MKRYYFHSYVIPLLNFLLSALLFQCTSNPFFNDSIEQLNRLVVKGEIRLNDSQTHDNIFVWLEGLEINDYSDANGKFSLELPTPTEQAVSGIYKIFYYVGNYEMETSSVGINNGEFIFGAEDINNEGKISNIIMLQKLVNIETTIEQSNIFQTDSLWLKVHTTFTPMLGEPVNVLSYKTPANYFTRVFLKKVNDPIENAVLIEGGGREIIERINSNITWEMNFEYMPNLLEPGDYEVIPYFRIIQEELPNELISSIDENAIYLNNEYLKIPYNQQVGYLKVLSSND